MATHSIGKLSKTVGINIPITRANEIILRADAMGISVGLFCKTILIDFLDSGKVFPFKTETQASVKNIKKRVAEGEKPGPRTQGRYTSRCPTGHHPDPAQRS